MDITELREKIDTVDTGIIELFKERMEIAKDIALYKAEKGLPVLDSGRERNKLNDVSEKAGESMAEYTRILFSLLMDLSKSYQDKVLRKESVIMEEISSALESDEKAFPKRARIACQGVEGAYSQLATDKIFDVPRITYFKNFEGVFSAIEQGLCDYGVLPLENSTAGSVNKIYDLMIQHRFHIVRSVRLKVDHNLLVKKGTKLSEIKEIFSHEQAINQSAGFLKQLGAGVKVTVCENTAIAAKMVSESDRKDVAALSSRSCAALYNLDCLAESVQDKGNNFTRFICISKKLEIYPGADRTSIMMILSHKPGALYKLLSKFFVLGINLVKIESRPIPDRDFEFMFYFDLETSVYSEEFKQLICDLDATSEDFRYLGSYQEIV